MRTLVVEDEAPLRELAERLRVEGYVVDLADGEEGAIGREYPVDLAIVDLGLPKLPGVEGIRRWRDAGLGFPVPDPDRAWVPSGQGRGSRAARAWCSPPFSGSPD